MDLNIEQQGEALVITFTGNTLDAGNATEFKQILASHIGRNPCLVLNMENLQFVDSTGCGALVSCLRQASSKGGDIKMANVAKPVRVLFDLVRLHRIFEIYDDVAAAAASYSTPGGTA